MTTPQDNTTRQQQRIVPVDALKNQEGIILVKRSLMFDLDSFEYLHEVKKRMAEEAGREPSNSLVLKRVLEEHREATNDDA